MRPISERDVDRVRMTMDQVASSASQDVVMFNSLCSTLGTTIDPQFANLQGLPLNTTIGQQDAFTFFLSVPGFNGPIMSLFTRPQ